ncbi:RICIN domain-containing protein [Jatrophihabitans sp. DSM 45814]
MKRSRVVLVIVGALVAFIGLAPDSGAQEIPATDTYSSWLCAQNAANGELDNCYLQSADAPVNRGTLAERATGWLGHGDVFTMSSRTPGPAVSPNSYNQLFSLHMVKNGVFQIRNSNDCLMPGWFDGWYQTRLIEAHTCDGSNTWEQWNLEPYRNSHGEQAYIVRNNQDQQCLATRYVAMAATTALTLWPCDGSNAELWKFPDETGNQNQPINDRLTDLAAVYAMGKCDAIQSSDQCIFTQTAESIAGHGAPVCVSQYFSTDTPVKGTVYTATSTYATSKMTGESYSLGETEGVSVHFGGNNDFFQAVFSSSVTSTFTRQNQTTTTTQSGQSWQTSGPDLQPNEYGWILEQPITKTYRGKYVFDVGGFAEWTYAPDADIVVNVPFDLDESHGLMSSGKGPIAKLGCPQAMPVTH